MNSDDRRARFEALAPAVLDAVRRYLVRRTDDLWLHRHALRGGFPVGQVREVAADFPVQLGSQDSALFRTNLNGGNDHVVSRLYDPTDLELLREHARG